MQRIDTENNSATLPPTETGTETPGYFSNGDPGLSIPGTKISADWLNGIQEELISVMTAAGISPDKTDNAQLLASILQLIEDNAVQDADLVASIQANAIHGTVGTTAWKAAVATGADPREITSTPVEINSTGVVANATSIHIGADLLTKDASAALEVTSTTKGLLLPRLTTGQRDAIASPTAGLIVHNTTTDKPNIRTSSNWVAPISTVSGLVQENIAFASGYGSTTAAGLVAGALIGIREFLSGTSATYTPTPGTRLIFFEIVGGGGGAAGLPSNVSNFCASAGGGGSSSVVRALINISGLTAVYSIGSGGSGGPAGAIAGSAGGNSSITISGLTWIAGGGGGGSGNSGSSSSTTAGGGTGGLPTLPASNPIILYQKGFSGQTPAYSCATNNSGAAVSTCFAPQGGRSIASFQTSTDQSQFLNFRLFPAGSSFSTGFLDGEFPGGGGGGSASNGSSSASAGRPGMGGRLMVWEYA